MYVSERRADMCRTWLTNDDPHYSSEQIANDARDSLECQRRVAIVCFQHHERHYQRLYRRWRRRPSNASNLVKSGKTARSSVPHNVDFIDKWASFRHQRHTPKTMAWWSQNQWKYRKIPRISTPDYFGFISVELHSAGQQLAQNFVCTRQDTGCKVIHSSGWEATVNLRVISKNMWQQTSDFMILHELWNRGFIVDVVMAYQSSDKRYRSTDFAKICHYDILLLLFRVLLHQLSN